MGKDSTRYDTSFIVDSGRKCKCGCGETIWESPTKTGTKRLYVDDSHQRKYAKDQYDKMVSEKKKDNKPKYCACGCGQIIPDKKGHRARKYIDDVHRQKHILAKNAKIMKIKHAETTRKYNLAKKIKNAWKTNSEKRAKKFWEMFGAFGCCSICGKSFEDQMNEHGVPLHAKLQDGVYTYEVLNRKSYITYCTDCYVHIEILKDFKDKTGLEPEEISEEEEPDYIY